MLSSNCLIKLLINKRLWVVVVGKSILCSVWFLFFFFLLFSFSYNISNARKSIIFQLTGNKEKECMAATETFMFNKRKAWNVKIFKILLYNAFEVIISMNVWLWTHTYIIKYDLPHVSLLFPLFVLSHALSHAFSLSSYLCHH